MVKVKNFFASFLVFSLAVVICQLAYAQRLGDRQKPRKRVGVLFETLEEGVKQDLIQLKKEDPEKFRTTAKEVLEERRKELEKIKEENPEQFYEITTEARRKLKERITTMARKQGKGKELFDQRIVGEDSPGKQKMHKMILFETLSKQQKEKIISLRSKYRETLASIVKKKFKQLKEIRENNPEKFERIMEKAKDRVRQRMTRQKEDHPQRFEKFRRMNPDYLKEKMEWLREEDSELYRYIVEKAKRGYQRPFQPELREPLFDNLGE